MGTTTLRAHKIGLVTSKAQDSFSTKQSVVLENQRTFGIFKEAFDIKQSMVSAGWTVYKSSDGVNVSNSDLWSSTSSLATIIAEYCYSGNYSSNCGILDSVWICLKSPNMITINSKSYYLHVCLSANDTMFMQDYKNGYYMSLGKIGGSINMGICLSESDTAFSGGSVGANNYNADATYSTITIGTLPSATNEIWCRLLGYGCGITDYNGYDILTNNNQLCVILHYASTETSTYYTNNFMFCLSEILDESDNVVGYGIIQDDYTQMEDENGMYGFTRAKSLVTGASNNNSVPPSHDSCWYHSNINTNANTFAIGQYDNYYGPAAVNVKWNGFNKMVYTKVDTDGTTILTGVLGDPVQPWANSIIYQKYVDNDTAEINIMKLYAVSASDKTHYSLGKFSDFLCVSSLPAPDKTIANISTTTNYFMLWNYNICRCIKWDNSHLSPVSDYKTEI